MLAIALLPLSRTSSISSVGSADSKVGGNTSTADVSVDGVVKRTRKRFNSVQLMMLEHLYHKASHPTREQREQVAREAEIDLRSVTVWFQNKRQTDRRLHRQLSETTSQPCESPQTPVPPSSPFSDASGNTIHTIRVGTRTPSETLSAVSVGSASRSRSMKRDRDIPSRHIRLKPSRHLSLDDIARRAERPVLLPRTPPQHTAPSSPMPSSRSQTPAIADNEEDDAVQRALWENMPSSPAKPEPAQRAERSILRYGSRRYTLEYACARETVSVRGGEGSKTREERPHSKRRQQRRIEGLPLGRGMVGYGDSERSAEVPVADWDMHEDTDTEGFCSETPVTPSSSFSFVDDGKQEPADENHRKYIPPTDVQVAQNESDAEDLIDVAYVLCGLSQRR